MNVEEMYVRLDTLCCRMEDLLAELQQAVEKRPHPYAKVREKYPNAGKPWTATDDGDLRQLFREGQRIEDLALRFGRTSNGISQRLERLGVTVPESAIG